jgi:hypothetical protein
VFELRKALTSAAKRAGWIGFVNNIEHLPAIGTETKYEYLTRSPSAIDLDRLERA